MNIINFINEDIEFSLNNESNYIDWLLSIAKKENASIDSLTYVFCSDNYLLSINKEYLNHDYFTDIITFDNSSDSKNIYGDIFISVERVKDNSIEFKTTFENELKRVISHGILHLIGYNDKTNDDKTLMRQKENTYISLYK